MKAVMGMLAATILTVAFFVPATTSLAVNQGHTAPAMYNTGDKGEALTTSGGGALSQGYSDGVLPQRYSDVGMGVCGSHDAIQYTQTTRYLPNGLPAFTVTFSNTCPICGYTNIHISCGAFSSTVYVDPTIFKKLSDDDCLLSNGGVLGRQDSISFEYSSTSAYPMAIRSALPTCF